MQEAFEGAPKWVKIPCGCCSLYILAMIVLVVGAIVVGVIWAAVDSDDADDTSRQDEANETVPTLSGPGGIGVIGETMVSPPYALTVDYKPSVALSVGKGPEADGRFVIVPIRVTNVGTGGIDMFTNAKLALIDEDDRRFEAAPLAVQSTFGGLVVQPIDPGDTYEGVVVFDVPRDATQLHLEVDGSLFARTVTIDLGVFP